MSTISTSISSSGDVRNENPLKISKCMMNCEQCVTLNDIQPNGIMCFTLEEEKGEKKSNKNGIATLAYLDLANSTLIRAICNDHSTTNWILALLFVRHVIMIVCFFHVQLSATKQTIFLVKLLFYFYSTMENDIVCLFIIQMMTTSKPFQLLCLICLRLKLCMPISLLIY